MNIIMPLFFYILDILKLKCHDIDPGASQDYALSLYFNVSLSPIHISPRCCILLDHSILREEMEHNFYLESHTLNTVKPTCTSHMRDQE